MRKRKDNIHHPETARWRAAAVAMTTTMSTMILIVLVSSTSHAVTNPVPGVEGQHSPYIKRGQLLIEQMSVRSSRIHDMLRYARKAQKRRASRCLDRKLNQAHAMERMGSEDYQHLQRAAKRGEDELASQHYARLERFDERSHFVMNEANGCGVRVKKKRSVRR